MATIVNKFPDRRFEQMGAGLGGLIARVMAERDKKKQKEKEKAAMSRAADLVRTVSAGEGEEDESDLSEALFDAGVSSAENLAMIKVTTAAKIEAEQRTQDRAQEVFDENLENTRVLQGEKRKEVFEVEKEKRQLRTTVAAEQRGEAKTKRAEVRGEEAEKRGEQRDATREAQLLSEALARVAREKHDERVERHNVGLVIERVVKNSEGLTPGELFNTVATYAGEGQLPTDVIFDLMDRIPDLADQDRPDNTEELQVFDKESGRATTAHVPPEIVTASKADQDAYFARLGFNVTAQPLALQTGEEREILAAIESSGGGEWAEKLVRMKRAGLIHLQTLQNGDTVITDLQKKVSSYIINPKMDAQQQRQVAFRISSIEDALNALNDIDVTKTGVDDWLAAKLGGLAITAPLGGIMAVALDFLGLEPSEIVAAQASRAGYFATLAPFAQAIAPSEGERHAISSPAAIDLAKEILLITKPGTTQGAAYIAVERAKGMLTKLKVTLMAQLQHKSNIRPRVIKTHINEESPGHFTVNRSEEE